MVSSTVAPGHAACTTIVLIVKFGSSLRPRRLYENRPIATIMTIRNHTSARWRSAHSERFMRCSRARMRRRRGQPHLLPGAQRVNAGNHDDVTVLDSAGDDSRRGLVAHDLDGPGSYDAGVWIDDPDGRLSVNLDQRSAWNARHRLGARDDTADYRRSEAHRVRRTIQSDLHHKRAGRGISLWRDLP